MPAAAASDSGRMDGVSLPGSLVAAPASPRPNCNTDSEEDTMNGGLHTFNQTHMRKAFQLMNELRSKKMLCDVQLVAGSVEVPAHRVVLASCSPYFCDMSESKAHQVEIREVDGQTLRKLVDYIYTAEIEVTEDNVQVLLPAASLLQLMDVRQVCCEFLQSQLHPTNCLGIRAFADLHTCTQLLDQAHAYAEQHFSEVVQGEEFLGLSLQQVCSLISCDKLTVSTEEKVSSGTTDFILTDQQQTDMSSPTLAAKVSSSDEFLRTTCPSAVFEAMISWIKSDKPARLEYMPKLMEHVRLPLLSRDYLVQIVEEEALIKNNNTCKDFLIEAMKYHLLPADQRHLIKTDRTRPRTPISVVSMGGRVFAVGGFNSSLRERTVDAYDAARDQWSAVASMQERRSTLGAAVLGDLLYAVGGFNGSIGLSTVEVLNYKTNEWITVEEYDPVADQWCYVADMSTRRRVGVLSGQLYAAGGHDGPLVRKSVEVYDPTTNSWRLVCDMNMCRRNAGVCAINGLLYVIGGDDGSCNLSSVEYYNPAIDKWSLIPTNMSNGRSYAGVAVVDKPL
ncbi:Kelch-like protein 3 [Dissostichus eleginoides]|uniref:Kelch-like protein 3 n=1 Tax=Dissostichus eleginoides TaxID=100907 RepID=A0AAD9FJT8_DISEL|nr:Kelch-like protein 3 [Dissostichus eleginoides]